VSVNRGAVIAGHDLGPGVGHVRECGHSLPAADEVEQ
jgi:hypothetical protein